MFDHVPAPRRVLIAAALGLALPAVAFAQCPPADQVGMTIKKVFKNPAIEVRKISPAALKGLCEIQVSFQGRPNALYTDAKGSFLLTGHLIEVEGGKDLTEEMLQALNSLSPDEIKKVDALVAMTVGAKGPPVYFVTDPM